jgi:ATP-dependent Clp protease adaptor protein ClpS
MFSLLQKDLDMPQAEATTTVKTKKAFKEPPMFKVIYLNDNTTSMEFVVGSLIEFFDYNIEAAHKITVDIHEAGLATVAVLPYEIAEQKGIEVTVSARSQDYPLQIKLEPETNL